MAVRGVSNAVCSHSHLFQPLCPKLSLTTRVANVFLLALAVVIGALIYHAIYRSDPPKGPPPPTPHRTPPQTPEKAQTDRPPSLPPVKSAALVQPHAKITPLSVLKIHSISEIDNIPKIVGVSIDLIEQRAKPTVYRRDGTTIAYKGETARGFIPDGNSVLETIGMNWAQAESAEISHTEIAGHLHHLIEAARAKPKTVICYDPRTGAIDPADEKIPRFQVSIREKEDPDTDIFRPTDARPNVGASYEEAVIINTAVQGKYIRWTPVRERYIGEFGFYSTGMEFETVLAVLMTKVK